EDGIRDFHVTGVQTCALPIYLCFHLGLRECVPHACEGLIELLLVGGGDGEVAAVAELAVAGDELLLLFLQGIPVRSIRRRTVYRSEERRVGKAGRPRRVT